MLGGEKYPKLEKEHAPKLESYCGGLTLFPWHESRIAHFVSDPVSCHISSVPSEDCSRSHACLASWYLSCYRCGPIPNWKRSESSPLLPILWQFGGREKRMGGRTCTWVTYSSLSHWWANVWRETHQEPTPKALHPLILCEQKETRNFSLHSEQKFVPCASV